LTRAPGLRRATFLASAVEMVEALRIVLALGISVLGARGPRHVMTASGTASDAVVAMLVTLGIVAASP
jgi:uncharacterized membrane protein